MESAKQEKDADADADQELPVGYRFAPTEEELVHHYLTNKVFHRPLPAQFIPEIDAAELYSKPPMDLVDVDPVDEKEWYFFVHQDEYFCGVREKIRAVGNGLGFWRSIGEEDPICNSEGEVFAFKIYFTYFSGSSNAKKTHWRMETYRLPFKDEADLLQRDKWVLGRLKRGQDYITPP